MKQVARLYDVTMITQRDPRIPEFGNVSFQMWAYDADDLLIQIKIDSEGNSVSPVPYGAFKVLSVRPARMPED